MCEYLNDRLFQENPHTVLELKTAIREESETIYKETITDTKLCIIPSSFT
jgi:hypothetical protein